MAPLNFILLAVRDPLKSAELYAKLLGHQPVDSAPTFVLFILENGLKLGLWLKDDMQPAPRPAGGYELSFSLPSKDAVLAIYEEWTGLGLKVAQEPTDMDFGYTFVLEDEDGHRLRPFVPAER